MKEKTNHRDIPLKNKKYYYLYDYNVIVNKEFKNLFYKHGEDKKLTIKQHNVDQNKIRSNLINLPQLILETTQDCTLVCKYCIFGDTYLNHRSPQKKDMPFAVAKKGIDYISSIIQNKDKKEFSISFYGGEPLMNFPLIKQVVAYAKSKFKDWDLNFNLTTNLTVFTEDMLDFFINHNFQLVVSLDGSRENHDAKRVFPDGRGSFNVVMDNLKKIKKKSKEYYKTVSFNAVFSNDLSYEKFFNFFNESQIVKRNLVRVSGVDDFENNYYSIYPDNKGQVEKDNRTIMRKITKKMGAKGELTPIERILITPIRMCNTSLNVNTFTSQAGNCLFDSRLFIDVDGRFHICERINDKFLIGDVFNGLDFKTMETMLNQFSKIIENECSKCSVRFFCNPCFATFGVGDEFEINKNYCEDQRKFITIRLDSLVHLKQKDLI